MIESKIEVGKKYRFDTLGSDSTWKTWDGNECTVVRALTEEEYDIEDVGPMWKIRFNDKRCTEADAFDDELYGPLQEKIVLMCAGDAQAMIDDLQYGGRTDFGDRKSQYFKFATVSGLVSYMHICLIEDKRDLAVSEWGYRLHVLNDIDKIDGYFISTDRLDTEELEQLLDQLAYDACHGRV